MNVSHCGNELTVKVVILLQKDWDNKKHEC